VAELFRGKLKDFDYSEYLDVIFYPRFSNAVRLSKDSPCDEGICIRIDNGIIPVIMKAKGSMFLNHETIILDSGVIDMETSN